MPARYHFADFFQQNFMQPWSTVVDAALGVVNDEANPLRDTPLGRWQAASLESTSRLLGQYPKRAFGLDETVVAGKPVAVTERVVLEKPFCRLLNLAKSTRRRQPKLLFVAALAGHHATLARETYGAFLPDYDVHVTDWCDARIVSHFEADPFALAVD